MLWLSWDFDVQSVKVNNSDKVRVSSHIAALRYASYKRSSTAQRMCELTLRRCSEITSTVGTYVFRNVKKKLQATQVTLVTSPFSKNFSILICVFVSFIISAKAEVMRSDRFVCYSLSVYNSLMQKVVHGFT